MQSCSKLTIQMLHDINNNSMQGCGKAVCFIGKDFYIDLLFYHLKLRWYVVIELKATGFKPEYAGKLNFYLSAVDATMRHENDNPSIGLILCKDRKGLIAEYALKDISKPVGVSEYQLVAAIPENLKGNLPTIEELEAEFADGGEDLTSTKV